MGSAGMSLHSESIRPLTDGSDERRIIQPDRHYTWHRSRRKASGFTLLLSSTNDQAKELPGSTAFWGFTNQMYMCVQCAK